MLLIITQLSIAVFVVVGTAVLLMGDDNHPL
jgi:hypothetical protein